MYQSFFGLNERPFQLTPNPRFLFLNSRYREALATLRYGLSSSLGITLLLGEAGTGKTTLLRAALEAERNPNHRHVVLSNPTLAPADFYEILSEAFSLPHVAGSKGRFLMAFERDLLERHRAGGLTALVVDEAQSLTHELFEELRLLANLETATDKLLSLVLVGQQELADRLNDPSLRQLKQRVVLRCSLAPLNLQWTASYIAARLRVAGAVPTEVFSKDAVIAIYEASRGIPRTIGVVCENALLAGFAAQQKPVGRSLVAEVCRDLDLSLDGRSSRGDGPLAGQSVAAQGPPARIDPGPRRPSSRFWVHSGNTGNQPGPADEDQEVSKSADRSRGFRFF
jgi:type II secretory pathway predicted ATPase ExeA